MVVDVAAWWTSVQGDAALLRRRLRAVVAEKADQGHDTMVIADRLETAPASTDALIELAAEAAALPLRGDWPYHEPTDLDDIWDECVPQRPTAPVGSLTATDAARRVRTAFLASVCGCMLGKPVEVGLGLAELRGALESLGEWPVQYYVPEAIRRHLVRPLHESWPETVRERIRFVAADDDINYTLLGMLLLEQHGTDFTRGDIAAMWLRHLPVLMTFGPERTMLVRAATASLEDGAVDIEDVGSWAEVLNPGEEWCGALIRADAYGYAFPGQPHRAAELAWRDATLTHRRTGVYAAMFVAAAIATAPVADHPMDIVEAAVTFVPRRSRLHEALRRCIDAVRDATDWIDAYQRIHRRYGQWGHCRIFQELGTLVNTLAFARDVGSGIGLQVSQGNDTDSFGATAGSILGAYHGADGLDDRWLEPFGDDLRTGLAHFPDRSLSSVADRMARLADTDQRPGGHDHDVDNGPAPTVEDSATTPRRAEDSTTLALIARDERKEALVALLRPYRDRLSTMNLIATGHTGKIADELGLDVERLRSGPQGGDVQIGARLVDGRVDALIFLRDPLTAHPHEPDIQALLKLCDTHDIVVATNGATATLVLEALTAGR